MALYLNNIDTYSIMEKKIRTQAHFSIIKPEEEELAIVQSLIEFLPGCSLVANFLACS